MKMNDEERKELIFKFVTSKVSAMTEDDLRAYYIERQTDWFNEWGDDELLEIMGHINMQEYIKDNQRNRLNTNKLCDMIAFDYITEAKVLTCCLKWMGERAVTEMCNNTPELAELFDDEESGLNFIYQDG